MEKLGILANVLPYRIVGIICLVVGVLYIIAPKVVKKIELLGEKVLWKSEYSTTHRFSFGLFFLIAGILLCYAGFIMLKR